MNGFDHDRRPRPVADAPIVDATDCAKRWLLELVATAPLEAAATVAVADLAHEGPGLCRSVAEAVRSDDALLALQRDDAAASVGRLIGDHDPVAIVTAVDALRRALSRACYAALPEPGAALAADLGDRLAHVCSIVLARSLAEPTAAPATDTADLDPPITEPELQPDRPLQSARGTRIAAVDQPVAAVGPSGGAWRTEIEHRLGSHAPGRRPFGLVAVEIDDVDRLVAAQSGREAVSALEAAERALTEALDADDVVTRERLGRHWIVTERASEPSIRELGERVAAAVAGAATLGGFPLTASVGLAVHPQDGTSVDELAAKADEGMFAARAAGVRLA